MKKTSQRTKDRLLAKEDITRWFRYHEKDADILNDIGMVTYH